MLINLEYISNTTSTGRKGVVYLMGYPIPYSPISYHGTVSRGVTPDLL